MVNSGEYKAVVKDILMADKPLASVFDAILKKYEGAILDLGKVTADVPCYSTGHFLIDRVLGGGIPKGRIVELWGPEGSGKSTLSLQTSINVQKMGKAVLYIDYENAFDIKYAKALGLDTAPDKLVIVQPDNGEQGFEIMRELLPSIGLVIVDSIAAVLPKDEDEMEMGHHNIGLQSRVVSQMIKQVCKRLATSEVPMIAINQIRSNITTMGSSETTPGGRALKFYASIRVKMYKIEGLKQKIDDFGVKATQEGQVVRIGTVKNKIAAPFRECEVKLYFGKGFSEQESLLDVALERRIIEKSGSYFTYKGKSVRGWEELRATLDWNEVKKEVLDAHQVSSARLPDPEEPKP